MLRDDRALAALIGFDDRQNMEEPESQRGSRDVERRRPHQPRRHANIGWTANPRQGNAPAIVNRDRNRIGHGVTFWHVTVE